MRLAKNDQLRMLGMLKFSRHPIRWRHEVTCWACAQKKWARQLDLCTSFMWVILQYFCEFCLTIVLDKNQNHTRKKNLYFLTKFSKSKNPHSNHWAILNSNTRLSALMSDFKDGGYVIIPDYLELNVPQFGHTVTVYRYISPTHCFFVSYIIIWLT